MTMDETSGAYHQSAPSPTAQPDSAVKKMRRRANNWRSGWIIVTLLGLFGAGVAAIATYAASVTTSAGFYDTTTSTHHAGAAWAVFAGAATSAILFALPLLGFAHVIDGQADLYES